MNKADHMARKNPDDGFPELGDFEEDPKKIKAQIQAERRARRGGTMPLSGASDPLWIQYGIRSDLPERAKIEKLLLLDVLLEEIAHLVQKDVEEVRPLAEEIQNSWRRLGKAPTQEEREEERGRMIRNLQDLRIEVQKAQREFPDARNHTLLLQIEDRIARLMSLDTKGETSGDDGEKDAVLTQLESLDKDRLAYLVSVLSQSSPSASAGPT
jgi:hypothetical protein